MPIASFKTVDNPIPQIIDLDNNRDSDYINLSNILYDVDTQNSPLSDIIDLDECKAVDYHTLTNMACDVATLMPFRIRFQTIDSGAYSPSNVPPIGIAIIGFNNYIL